MNESQLIAAIDGVIIGFGYSYGAWTVGITNDPDRRKQEHQDEGQNVGLWRHWKADSESTARSVEQYFLKKGCKGGTGGGDYPTYVYIF
jgi:hypothetical protein